MNTDQVVDRVRCIAAASEDASADRSTIEQALRSVSEVEAWSASRKARLAAQLAPKVSFPEKTIADCTRGSLNDGLKATERADTLGKAPEFADALDEARVTPAHVDAITKIGKGLTGEQKAELFERVGGLVDVAAVATVKEFQQRLEREVKLIQREDGMARLERQRRATSLRPWTDGDGMFCLSGRFDPLTGVRLAAKLDAAREGLFAEATPDTCPVDPVEKQRHLHALALAKLVVGEAPVRSGRPEYVVVVDASQDDGAGSPVVDWGIPVEVPARVLAEMIGDADPAQVHTIVIRNGVVLHAPGELDLGRTSRLANRAQRRAMRALYATCAIPGCSTHLDRCKLHHIHEWEHGGPTDFANLLPLCPHHHAVAHADGWRIELGANRELTITLPDGTVLATGPPSRAAA